MIERDAAMTHSLTKTLLTAVAIGLAATVPFMVMELVNTQGYRQGFPVLVFGSLWVTASVFFAALLLIVRNLRKARHTAPSWRAVLRLVAIVLVLTLVVIVAADSWMAWVSDQWLCFMGVPNCD
jgi:lysylphosphatidylglycerol synthetase-like protein (DUF2156 family)